MEIVVILHHGCLRGYLDGRFLTFTSIRISSRSRFPSKVTVGQKFIITKNGLCYVWAWVVINHSFRIFKSGDDEYLGDK